MCWNWMIIVSFVVSAIISAINVSNSLCIPSFNILQLAPNQIQRVSTSYEVRTITLNIESLTSMLIESIMESRCLTQTSDNFEYFLWSHWLWINKFQLYMTTRCVSETPMALKAKSPYKAKFPMFCTLLCEQYGPKAQYKSCNFQLLYHHINFKHCIFL